MMMKYVDPYLVIIWVACVFVVVVWILIANDIRLYAGSLLASEVERFPAKVTEGFVQDLCCHSTCVSFYPGRTD
jgi:hypothetical protein